jgi:predicted metal-dependent hydrolase
MMTAQEPPRGPERDRNAQGRPENARPRDRFGAPLPRGAGDQLADRRDPAEVVRTIDEAFVEAVRLFDEQRFFEAHEFLEYIWKSDEVPSADRDFWKGVTQVAVGCVHTQRGNSKGAITLLERAGRYMAPYPPTYRGVAADALAAAAVQLANDVREKGASAQRRFFAFPRA